MTFNPFSIVNTLFKGLSELGVILWDFVSKPLGSVLVNAPLIEKFFDIKIFDINLFGWLENILVSGLNFSIIQALPYFILIGLAFAVIKHFLP